MRAFIIFKNKIGANLCGNNGKTCTIYVIWFKIEI